ncbi:aspartate kinase, partial [Micromonospora chalcea]
MLVQKYGGTSLQTLDRVRHAALRIAAARRDGSAVTVVVSARGSRTDDLLRLAADVGAAGPSRELDQLLAVGESESAALMALALTGLGVPAVSLTGHQAEIHTT